MYKFEHFISEGKNILIFFGLDALNRYKGITVDGIYRKPTGYFDKQLFKLAEHIPFISKRAWYGNWADSPGGYDLIIVVNGIRGRDVAEFLRKNNPDARIIIYYETTIDYTDRKAPHFYQGLGIEFWSFDKGDCEKWNAKYNQYFHTFYQHDLTEILAEKAYEEITAPPTRKTDIFFCGYDKDRLARLVDLQKQLNTLDISTNFVIVRTPHKYYSAEAKNHSTSEHMAYDDIVKNIRNSRAILDFVSDGQTGITLRPMEAIFFKRKLITNNPDVKNYDFYRKENVFILGEESLDELKDFLHSPYEEVPAEIINNYLPEAWLDRFFE